MDQCIINEMMSKNFLRKHGIKEKQKGWIYVFKNGDRFKIGKTKNSPTERMKQLSIKEAGELVFTMLCKDYHVVEKTIHYLLKDKRIEGSEWFEDIDDSDIEKISKLKF